MTCYDHIHINDDSFIVCEQMAISNQHLPYLLVKEKKLQASLVNPLKDIIMIIKFLCDTNSVILSPICYRKTIKNPNPLAISKYLEGSLKQ